MQKSNELYKRINDALSQKMEELAIELAYACNDEQSMQNTKINQAVHQTKSTVRDAIKLLTGGMQQQSLHKMRDSYVCLLKLEAAIKGFSSKSDRELTSLEFVESVVKKLQDSNYFNAIVFDKGEDTAFFVLKPHVDMEKVKNLIVGYCNERKGATVFFCAHGEIQIGENKFTKVFRACFSFVNQKQ